MEIRRSYNHRISTIPTLVRWCHYIESGPRCFGTKVSVAAVLSTQPCISSYSWLTQYLILYRSHHVNTLRPRQNGRHFADAIFKWIFLNKNVWIPIKISLKLVPQGPINNIPALVQIMAWRRPGGKPLSGPMMVRLPTHICITRPQWVEISLIKI